MSTPTIVADAQALYRAAAEELLRQAKAAVQRTGVFTLLLSGGSTPKGLFTLLASDPVLRDQAPWEQTHVFWGDERHVPPDHPDSNYRLAAEALLSHAPLPAAHVHRIQGELPTAGQAAVSYEQELRLFFGLAEGQRPAFDLVYLGLGPDGHTASLFPGTKALHEQQRLVVANWVGKLYAERITLTAPAINQAACITFLVSGEDKALALKAVLEGPYEPEQLPAQLIQPASGQLVWLVDEAAAQRLTRSGSRKPTG